MNQFIQREKKIHASFLSKNILNGIYFRLRYLYPNFWKIQPHSSPAKSPIQALLFFCCAFLYISSEFMPYHLLHFFAWKTSQLTRCQSHPLRVDTNIFSGNSATIFLVLPVVHLRPSCYSQRKEQRNLSRETCFSLMKIIKPSLVTTSCSSSPARRRNKINMASVWYVAKGAVPIVTTILESWENCEENWPLSRGENRRKFFIMRRFLCEAGRRRKRGLRGQLLLRA